VSQADLAADSRRSFYLACLTDADRRRRNTSTPCWVSPTEYPANPRRMFRHTGTGHRSLSAGDRHITTYRSVTHAVRLWI